MMGKRLDSKGAIPLLNRSTAPYYSICFRRNTDTSHLSYSDGQVYRNVLQLMVSIIDGVSTDSMVAATATKPFQPSQPLHIPMRGSGDQPTPTTTAENATILSRRLDIGMAVSQAFDETLVQLAQELRGTNNNATHSSSSSSGGGGDRRRSGREGHAVPPRVAQSAIACASAAGLFMDACETIATCLLQAFRCLTEEPGGEQSHVTVGELATIDVQ